MNDYLIMKQRQIDEINAFPIQYAFTEEQFEKAMGELGLDPSDTGAVLRTPAGGFIRRSDKETYLGMFRRHKEELWEAIEKDKRGTGFIYDMFYYELRNHEYCVTGDPTDTLEFLGMTWEQVQSVPRMKKALDRAMKKAGALY